MTTMAYTDTLVVVSCFSCEIVYAIPQTMYKRAEARRGPGLGRVDIYCPAGHSWFFIDETDAQREARLRGYAEDQAAADRARADQAEASLRTTKGHVTRLRKRLVAGVCPFGCHRHFTDLERHVASIHPGAVLEGES